MMKNTVKDVGTKMRIDLLIREKTSGKEQKVLLYIDHECQKYRLVDLEGVHDDTVLHGGMGIDEVETLVKCLIGHDVLVKETDEGRLPRFPRWSIEIVEGFLIKAKFDSISMTWTGEMKP
jgi:hypothetical protein